MEVDTRTPEEKLLSSNPWRRKRKERWGPYLITKHGMIEKFNQYISSNIDLDDNAKAAALKVSESVVSLECSSGGKSKFSGSGTIIDCTGSGQKYIITVLTSATLFRDTPEAKAIANDIQINLRSYDGELLEGHISIFDLHYNIALVLFESERPLPCATLMCLDDSIPFNPRVSCSFRVTSLQSNDPDISRIRPGDLVVAMGRHFNHPYPLMAAPGKYSSDSCYMDCKELLRANCIITKCGIGGPLVNRFGQVIGINFYDRFCTPFLPMNTVFIFLEQHKKYGGFSQPWIGMQLTNLYAARLCKLERIFQGFPDIVQGAFVEKVVRGSHADLAGILSGDLIIKCNGESVGGLLEFFEMVLDKAEKTVELVVIREENHAFFTKIVNLDIEKTTSDKVYSWPLPPERRIPVNRIRY